MEKEEFKELEVSKQVEHVNGLLVEKQTLTQIAYSLGLGRTTLTRNFKKASYIYDSATKQYAISTITQEIKINNKPNVGKKKVDHNVDYSIDYVSIDKLDNRPVRRLKFSIPIKTRLKNTTKAFNVVMDKILVEKIDKLCKSKGGYSRNELINKMCEYAIDNME